MNLRFPAFPQLVTGYWLFLKLEGEITMDDELNISDEALEERRRQFWKAAPEGLFQFICTCPVPFIIFNNGAETMYWVHPRSIERMFDYLHYLSFLDDDQWNSLMKFMEDMKPRPENNWPDDLDKFIDDIH